MPEAEPCEDAIRVFSFHVSVIVSDLFGVDDENSCLKLSLPCLLCGRAKVSSEACAEVLGVGSGSLLTLGVNDS